MQGSGLKDFFVIAPPLARLFLHHCKGGEKFLGIIQATNKVVYARGHVL